MDGLLGESYGLSLVIHENRIVEFRDNIFKKVIPIDESFEALKSVALGDPNFYDTTPDKKDRIISVSPFSIGSLPVRNLVQNTSLGSRRIEVFAGRDVGNLAIRISFNLQRGMKWRIALPFDIASETTTIKDLLLPSNIKLRVYSSISSTFTPDSDYFYFALPGGYSEINFYFQSEINFEKVAKAMMIVNPEDLSASPIIEKADGESFFPLITFVSVGSYRNQHEKVNNLITIGSILISSEKFEQAVEYLSQALEITQNELMDKDLEIEILLKMGCAYEEAENYDAALQSYQQVSTILHSTGNQSALVNNYFIVGNVLEKIERYEDALSYFNEIYETGLIDQGAVLKKMTSCLIGLNRKDEAVNIRRQILENAQARNDKAGEAVALMDLGEILVLIGRVGEAMSMYEQAIRIRKNLNDERGVAESLAEMGNTLKERGKFEKAKQYLERSAESYQKLEMEAELLHASKEINKLIIRPYEDCENCRAACTLDLMGLAYVDTKDKQFLGNIKNVFRDAVQSKDMTNLAKFLYEKAEKNMFLASLGVPVRQYAFCIMVQLSQTLLSKMKPELRTQILKMIQDKLRSIYL
ncbi:MAG: tetratricopeptide repeat protein [Candidatus Lokiarchaeota archaeon]|nr:tetratricopeptide repeat protein [Candidatus Lokiarchaeota archaeon]